MPALLIVADELQILELLSFTFSMHGFTVDTARVAEAPEAVQTLGPDLVIFDLPQISGAGFTAVRAMRARWHCPPIVMLSGPLAPEHEATGRSLADAYLPKPCRPAQLLEVVQELLEEGQKV